MQPVLTLLICIYALFFTLVNAGPGTHRYDGAHSNYGIDKTNKEHIKEHLKALSGDNLDELPPLSDKDMIYYLFVIHDTNGDNHLDGHELRAAFTDFDDVSEIDPTEFISLEEVTEMVDHVLEEDDLDGDGRISWEEYIQSQLYHGQPTEIV
ncbi:uncharacterized protein BYT42DRAFT_536228 [Radiomyces spectabilis]|uniref:uncharacterized protein n=1 Tax=Radiomyces spectabilis TaxID=64574 RepID=UPI00221FB878|nr:uncharacterized protein BYT42DRAFT_536228 [Radiomyces spectabilis]KAI8372773.1 hypothetical protein BYT42DRAFT_536228 [Radiomyces spectabilis]